MPKNKRRLETSYYEPVRRYLESEMGCMVESFRRDGSVRPFINRGLERLIVDVYGLRGFKATTARTLEGVAIEVKRKRSGTPLRYVVQAGQYGKLAHRCYLAQPRDFDNKTKIEASKLGIGLLRIKGNRVQAIAESAPFTPDPDLFLLFLHRSLGIVRCSLCQCYRFRYRDKAASYRNDGYIRGHWVGDHIVARTAAGTLNKKMYICGRCEALLNVLTGANRLRRSVRRLEKRVLRLRQRLRRK